MSDQKQDSLQTGSDEREKTHRVRTISLKDPYIRNTHSTIKQASLNSLGPLQQYLNSEVTQTNVEIQFPSSFASYQFDSTKSQLSSSFEETKLQVEVWHQDRMKKDELIGTSIISLSELLKSQIRKTQHSYARVQDVYYPLDEVRLNQDTGQRDPHQRIGSLRVITYLEDLGPNDLLSQNERQLLDQLHINNDQISLPQVYQSDDPEKQKLIVEMNSLQQKVIWELETWQKNEEAKFKTQLKQREYDFLSRLQQEQKQKEYERERTFKQYLAQIQMIEQKMKTKSLELQKREKAIVQLEEELRSKIAETAKMIKQKDEESGLQIKKFKDEKLNYEKEKTLLGLKMTDQQGQVQKLQEEIARLKKDMENSPISIVKGDLQKKVQEITDLKKEIDKINQIKDQYKIYYEKVRDELVRQKKLNEELQQSQQNATYGELQKLKEALDDLKKSQVQKPVENPFRQAPNFDQSGSIKKE